MTAAPPLDSTRSRILRATRELYAASGTKGTTTRGVAKRAGVNEATLFRQFGTKNQLLSAMLEHFAGIDDAREMLAHVRTLPTIEAQLLELGMRSMSTIQAKADLIRVSMAEETANPERETSAWHGPSKAYTALREIFDEFVAAGRLRGDPDFLTRSFMSSFFTYVICAKLWAGYPADREDAARHIVDHFLNGART